MRESFLPFALPDCGDEEIREVAAAIRSGWITSGPRVREFETEFARKVGALHAVAVNSCTAALHLALEACGVERGDEVITTPYTFAATAEVIRYFDATPVFVDVQPDTLNIDPDRVDRAITPRTRAIIPVHFGGLPVDMSALLSIAQQHGLAIVEDAAHAFPASYSGRPIGSLGDFTCFSFYANKSITTAEGGMICTDNEARAERCRIMSLHGISRNAWSRYTEQGSWAYDIMAPGFKYNMTDVAAAMGVVQLRKADRMWRRRRQISRAYNDAFSQNPCLQTPADHDGCQHAWHLYPLRLRLDALRIGRDEFAEELRARRIGISVHYIPLQVHPYYRKTYRFDPEDFPVSFEEFGREISLPIYSRMTDEDVRDVIEAVQAIAHRHERVATTMGSVA